ncbi:Macrolide export protein MacA [Novipirellula aureliae]|uniref:Macrolide export protein MacA n=1 Tax=Novipirellula aureliae TaxID=2527966 RepID=A0A5C6DNR3_9BACT|nr:efflux RND transporter periplasmic adaptor subunit [Novipirellula aureliae]TWU37834.1 Macrolide export protein MacA [Novipirellula aureliae]
MTIDSPDITADELKSPPQKSIAGNVATRTVKSRRGQPHVTDASTGRALRKKRRKKKRRVVWWLFLFSMIGFSVGWWWYANRTTHSAETVVSTATVIRCDFSSSVLATGAVQPQVGAEVRVGARLSGKVERLYANIGDKVTKKQVIARLEQSDLEATVRQRQAELDLARAKLTSIETLLPTELEKAQLDLDECQATYTLNEKECQRQRQLHSRGAAADDELEEAEERFAVSRTHVATARKELELVETRFTEEIHQARPEISRAMSALEHAQVQLSYATITAPIDGVIASVSTEEGETVAAGMQAPTFVTIIDLQRLQVDAYVDEVDIGKVQVGQRSVFTVDAFPESEFEGRVSAIYPTAFIQDNVVNYDVVVDIETPFHGRLRPEMTASVTIYLEKRDNVLAIPAKAIKRERGRNVVYVSNHGQPEVRDVTIGWKDGQSVEIVAGLEEGQTVFLEPPLERQVDVGDKTTI